MQNREDRRLFLTGEIAVPLVRNRALPAKRMQFEELGTVSTEIQIWMCLELTKELTKRNMRIRREMLIRKEENLVLHQERADPIRIIRSCLI
jgi:hypothetical protein